MKNHHCRGGWNHTKITSDFSPVFFAVMQEPATFAASYNYSDIFTANVADHDNPCTAPAAGVFFFTAIVNHARRPAKDRANAFVFNRFVSYPCYRAYCIFNLPTGTSAGIQPLSLRALWC